MIDGRIEKGKEPGNSPAFAEATQALYSISYTLKFMFKKREIRPDRLSGHAVGGIVGFAGCFKLDVGKKDNWSYTLMILQPDIVTQESVCRYGWNQVRKKKGDAPALSKITA